MKLKPFLRRSAIIAAILIMACLAFAAAASADILYTASGSGYGNDRFGMIKGTGAPVRDLVTNLGGANGSGVFAYRDPSGASRVAVSQYTYNKDIIWIYDPYNTDWKAPLKEIGRNTNPVYNIRKMTASGDYLYAIGYDYAQVARFDMTKGYNCDKTFEALNDKCWHGEYMTVYKDCLYAVFTYSKDAWSPTAGYSPSKLVKFDKELKIVSSIDLNSRNIDGGGCNGACVLNGHTLYVASLGGFQHTDGAPNDNSMVEAVDLDAMTSRILVQNKDVYAKYPEITKWIYDFRSLCILPDGTVYVQNGGWNTKGADSASGSLIFKTTLAKLNNGDLGSIIKKFSWTNAYITFGMAYDPEAKIIYMSGADGTGDYNGSLYRYDGSNWLDRFDSAALGGNLATYDVLYAASGSAASGDTGGGTGGNPGGGNQGGGSSDGGSGGGCSAGSGALALLFTLPLLVCVKQKQ